MQGKISMDLLNGLLTPELGRTTGKNVWKLSATLLSASEITDVFHKIWDNNRRVLTISQKGGAKLCP